MHTISLLSSHTDILAADAHRARHIGRELLLQQAVAQLAVVEHLQNFLIALAR